MRTSCLQLSIGHVASAGVAAFATVAVVSLSGCAATQAARHQPVVTTASDGYLQGLVGEWTIERSIRGKIISNRMTVEPVLGGEFVQMHMISAASSDPYEAIVLVGFDSSRNEYVAHWCDSFGPGMSATGHGSRVGRRLELVFDYPSGLFYNTWESDPADGGWTFTGESSRPDGTRVLFARDVVTRRK